MKVEIENKDKPKTNHWKYYETKHTNNQTKPKQTHTKKKKKKKKTTENPRAFMIQI